jgi:hypothetical protein
VRFGHELNRLAPDSERQAAELDTVARDLRTQSM